ncbi:helix-turn-helix domain-containing protein [Actinoplanes palleronii]|uniref:HTH cro/C1-type domain-containing protein n=1 Tax=Actinoplanes palleronii TaxID=113570 RepID=A0ABQ4B3Y3_9ACTN|nr:helix-turn-helix transcriptional regulator [Actinoplanes palleronii]GIE65377.1 hypothetical protein Apa02nite_014850 [Actinoplanes palleronii]
MSAVATTHQRFAERLRLLRRAKALTGRALAERAGLPEHAVYRIEASAKGTSPRVPTLGEAVALADALGVDLAHLVAADVMSVTVPLGGAR